GNSTQSSFSFFDTGGRYDPVADAWSPTSTTNSPSARAFHAAVGADGEMFVWGGYDGSMLNTGGLYAPDPLGPPLSADAGPDQSLECSGPDGSQARLAGLARSCEDPTASIAYTWSGPFPEGDGTVHGVAP